MGIEVENGMWLNKDECMIAVVERYFQNLFKLNVPEFIDKALEGMHPKVHG